MLLSLASILACEEEAILPVVDELTVEAFLYAGQPLGSVSFGKVIPFDSVETLVAPGTISPIIRTASGETFPLYALDDKGNYGNDELFIEENQNYALEVEYNGQQITAETFVPTAPQNPKLSDTVVKRTRIDDFTDIFNQEPPDPIQVDWTAEDGAWYFVNVRNIEDDPEPINQLFEDEDIEFERPNFVTEPSIDPIYIINAFQDITHYGTYEVIIYRVNPEYVALYEDNSGSSGSLNEIRTNVQNGFGIFTAVNSTSLFFEVKP